MRQKSYEEAFLEMTPTKLIAAAFGISASRRPDTFQSWIIISHRLGGLLPDSVLVSSVQCIGELDVLLRCMENDYSPAEAPDDFTIRETHAQKMLSELWICSAYEAFRTLCDNERKSLLQNHPQRGTIEFLKRQLEMIRIPIAKHEIPSDRSLRKPGSQKKRLIFQIQSADPNQCGFYTYDSSNPQKAHIPPAGISQRGSVMWHIIDINKESKEVSSYWIERLSLSEQMMALSESISMQSDNPD